MVINQTIGKQLANNWQTIGKQLAKRNRQRGTYGKKRRNYLWPFRMFRYLRILFLTKRH
jgi:hypothetical protein